MTSKLQRQQKKNNKTNIEMKWWRRRWWWRQRRQAKTKNLARNMKLNTEWKKKRAREKQVIVQRFKEFAREI